jgi:hypothetical protein
LCNAVTGGDEGRVHGFSVFMLVWQRLDPHNEFGVVDSVPFPSKWSRFEPRNLCRDRSTFAGN